MDKIGALTIHAATREGFFVFGSNEPMKILFASRDLESCLHFISQHIVIRYDQKADRDVQGTIEARVPHETT